MSILSLGIWDSAKDWRKLQPKRSHKNKNNFINIPKFLGIFSSGVKVKVMGCEIVVSEFKLQLWYYVKFQTNTLGKGMNPLILPAIG